MCVSSSRQCDQIVIFSSGQFWLKESVLKIKSGHTGSLFWYFPSLHRVVNPFQAQPIPPELTAKVLRNCVAVSPIVTVEPRRRKFHKAITLTIPLPQAAGKGMINDYSSGSPPNSLRLLCSITGE